MKPLRAMVALLGMMISLSAFAADKIPDLTGADEATLRAHMGEMVTLRGKLGLDGMQGPYLEWPDGKRVTFYFIPEIPPGGFTQPPEWVKLDGRQVRATGVLMYHSMNTDSCTTSGTTIVGGQIAPPHFYMVEQKTRIEALQAK